MCLVPAPGEVCASRTDFFEYLRNFARDVGCFSDFFCEEWKLVSTNFNQIQVKQIILKDFGGYEHNKWENRGKKTVWILRGDSRLGRESAACCSNAMNSFPLGLRFAFCHQFLAYFDELYQWIHVCLFLTRYFTDKLRNKASFESKHRATRGRYRIEFPYAN